MRGVRAQAGLTDMIYLQHKTILSRLGEMNVLSSTQKLNEIFKENEETEEQFLNKEQEKTPKVDFKETDKWFTWERFQISDQWRPGESCINKLRISTERKYLKVRSRNHWIEKCSNFTRNYNSWFQHQTRQKKERIYELEDRALKFFES